VQEELQTELKATNTALEGIISTNEIPTAPAHPPRLVDHVKSTHNNNARIHPRSLYSTLEPDFATLAQEYPSLYPYLLPLRKKQPQPPSPIFTTNTSPSDDTSHRRRTIDFTNPAACRELTKILLKKDFGVTWDVPDGHLVPPVTNRLNYILWIEDLLNLSSPASTSGTSTMIKGLDIGCGASCIYPLLGTSLLNWHFVGVDVTDEAIHWAKKNVEMNPHLKDLIEVRKVAMQPEQKSFFPKNEDGIDNEKDKEEELVNRNGSAKGILASALKKEEDTTEETKENFAFSMCNPPFFEKFEHASANPSTAFGGTAIESVYPGGEESFVRNMLQDSLLLKDRVHWFTTMVGKKVTFKALKKWLHAEASVHVVRTTEFSQGQTSRWGVAWSFLADRSVSLKAIKRGEGYIETNSNAGCSTSNKRGAEAPLEEARQMKLPRQQQQQQVKNKKIIGRSVSLYLTLKESSAALHLLNHIKSELEESQSLKCSLDGSQYQLAAEPQVTAAAAAASSGFTVQLLAQQPRRYVMTIALAKTPRTNSNSTDTRTTMVWFSGVVAQIEAAVISHGATLH